MKENILRLHRIESESHGHDAMDKRRVLNSVICSYFDNEGNEYRKKFCSYELPTVPKFGTHKELNQLAEQF